jgi:hypothetical protein
MLIPLPVLEMGCFVTKICTCVISGILLACSIDRSFQRFGATATQFLLFTTLLSLGGLPPFIGFLPN